MSHVLALVVALLVEKPCMKLQKLFLPAPAPLQKGVNVMGTGAEKPAAAKPVKKERPRVFENPNAKYMR